MKKEITGKMDVRISYVKDPYHNFKSTVMDAVMGVYELPDGTFIVTLIGNDMERRELHICEESLELLRDMLTDCLERKTDKGV